MRRMERGESRRVFHFALSGTCLKSQSPTVQILVPILWYPEPLGDTPVTPLHSWQLLFCTSGLGDVPLESSKAGVTWMGSEHIISETISKGFPLYAEDWKSMIWPSYYLKNGSNSASKFTSSGKELSTTLPCLLMKIFVLFVLRMKLLRQVSKTWKTDGLNSCSYKLLSVEHNPLYVNITVDFSKGPKIS